MQQGKAAQDGVEGKRVMHNRVRSASGSPSARRGVPQALSPVWIVPYPSSFFSPASQADATAIQKEIFRK